MTHSPTLPDWVRAHAREVRKWAAVAADSDPSCLVEVCGRSAFAIGLCKAHYKRARRAFDPAFCDPRRDEGQ